MVHEGNDLKQLLCEFLNDDVEANISKHDAEYRQCNALHKIGAQRSHQCAVRVQRHNVNAVIGERQHIYQIFLAIQCNGSRLPDFISIGHCVFQTAGNRRRAIQHLILRVYN